MSTSEFNNNSIFLTGDELRMAISVGPPHDNGLVYALFYSEVLNELVQDNKISDYHETERNSLADSLGIDFYVVTNDDHEVPISITSTPQNMRQRIRSHPNIPSIYIKDRNEDRTRTVGVLKIATMHTIRNYVGRNPK